MEKIYLVLTDEVCDYNFCHNKPHAFKTKESAIKEFVEQAEKSKEAYPDWYCEESDESIVLYRDGEYSCNHCEIWIEEVGVEE